MRRVMLAGAFVALSGFASAARFVEIDVQPVIEAGGARLSIILKNERATELKILSGSLPWVDGVSGMQLTAYAAEPGGGTQVMKPLKSVGALLHGYEEVAIPAGAALAGSIELEQRFPGINARLAKEAVVIVWRYVPAEVGLPPPSEFTGAVLLQRRRP